MKQVGMGVFGWLVVISINTSCSSATEPKTTHLRFQGRVTARGGTPIAGATVALSRSTFVFSSDVQSVSTDADGRYQLEHEAICTPNQNLYEAPGSAYLLVAHATGYDDRSSVNMSRDLGCVSSLQVVDFELEPSAGGT